MLRKLGCFMLAFGLTLPVWAADKSGTISGYVRSSAGVPQMGAMVEVLSSAAHTFRLFTDENGFYSAQRPPWGLHHQGFGPYFPSRVARARGTALGRKRNRKHDPEHPVRCHEHCSGPGACG